MPPVFTAMCVDKDLKIYGTIRHVILMPPLFTAMCVDQDVEIYGTIIDI